MTTTVDGRTPLLVLSQKIVTSLDSFPVPAVPLFVLAGAFLATGGVDRWLVTRTTSSCATCRAASVRA